MKMSEEARKVWKTKAGGSLMGAMLGQHPMTPEGQAALDEIKAMNEAMRAEKQASEIAPPKKD